MSDVDETDYLAVCIHEDDAQVIAQGVAASYGMGASFARVDRSATAGLRGRTWLTVKSAAERAALIAWLSEHSVWWLRWNPERSESGTYADSPATRMAHASAIAWQRVLQRTIQWRRLVIDWVEQ